MDSTVINCHERLQGGANNSESANLSSETQPALVDIVNPEPDLPTDIVRAMAQTLGVEARTNKNAVLLGDVPCSLASMSMVFWFEDDATKINIPLDLLMTPTASIGQCSIPFIIGVKNGVASGLTSLGDPFLQAIYAVFDSEGEKVLLGQTIMNVTESDLVEYTG